MAYVVTEACIACRYGECVAVCPQGAFHAGPNFVVINPVTCANCGLCEMVCPVNAICAAADLPPAQQAYRQLNAQLSGVWPVVRDIDPLPDADAHAFDTDKRDRLVIERPSS
jgi:ferredoxin